MTIVIGRLYLISHLKRSPVLFEEKPAGILINSVSIKNDTFCIALSAHEDVRESPCWCKVITSSGKCGWLTSYNLSLP